MALHIRWSPKAARQLEAIIEYIAADAPRYATIFARRAMQLSVPFRPTHKSAAWSPNTRIPICARKFCKATVSSTESTPHIIEVVTICHGSRLIQNALDEPNG